MRKITPTTTTGLGAQPPRTSQGLQVRGWVEAGSSGRERERKRPTLPTSP